LQITYKQILGYTYKALFSPARFKYYTITTSFSPPVLGHCPYQQSTRWQCCSGKEVCDDVQSDNSERVGSNCYMDWSWWKARWYQDYYCGTCTDLWTWDQPIPGSPLPAVIRGRIVHLQGCNQHPKTEHMPPSISLQTTDSDKCVSYI